MRRVLLGFVVSLCALPASANVIFPAFTGPYVSALLFPVALATILLTEVFVAKALSAKLSILTVSLLILAANTVSSAVGLVIGALLPSGLVDNSTRGVVEAGPNFTAYFMLSFVVAYVLSVALEGGVLKLAARKLSITRPFRVSAVANTASYVLLVVIVWGQL